MLGDLWSSVSDVLGDGLSSVLESILNATIFKLFYYLEKALCWVIGVLMELFEVFAGLEPVTYNGKSDYLVNVFFSNKAINNIYWGMAILGMILIFVFTVWAVVKKMFDLEGKQQQSLGQIIASAVRSLFLIVGLTLVVSVVLSATGTLMRQIDYIFNNAYHLDQPKEREFSDEEYAAMGRVLATVGNYSMVPNSNNRYNLNLCFNDIRQDMYYLQEQGVFEFSYYTTDENGKKQESWQSVLCQIAKSSDLRQDVTIDVYHEGVARSITAAMQYLQTTSNPMPALKGQNNYTVTERTPLDRMIFLLGTFRAAKNGAYNEHPQFDDALRGPYYFEDDKSIYSYDDVNSDFYIGFETDYLLVWFASIALIFNLVVIILNCVARIFNMLLLYIIAPPFIASAPLDNGGKLRQWTIAFTIQSLSVFGTVIAMQLMLIYLPIVASPDLVLFKDRPLLNGIAQFMLVYGGSEAAKKAGSLVTGILADQAGMEAIRSGDMSGAAGRVLSKATSAVTGVAGAAAGVAGFVMSPATNLIKRPFKAAGNFWRNLGSGNSQNRADKAVQDEIAKNKAIERHKEKHPEDAKYLGGPSGSGPQQPGSQPSQQDLPSQQGNPPPQQQNPHGGRDNDQGNQPQQPPPRNRDNAPKSFEAEDAQRHTAPQPGSRMADIRERAGLDEGPGDGGPGGGQGGQGGGQGGNAPAGGQGGAGAGRPARPAREMNATGNRPTLDKPPPVRPPQRNNNANRVRQPNAQGNNVQQNRPVNQNNAPMNGGNLPNPNAAGPNHNNMGNPQPPVMQNGQFGNPPQQGQDAQYQAPPQQGGYQPQQPAGAMNNNQIPNQAPRQYQAPQHGTYQVPPQQNYQPPQQGYAPPNMQGNSFQQQNQPQQQGGYQPQPPTGTVNNNPVPNQVPRQYQPQPNVQYQVPPQQGGYRPQQGQNVQYQAPPQPNMQYQAAPQQGPNMQYQAPQQNAQYQAPPQQYQAPPQNVQYQAPPQNVQYQPPAQNQAPNAYGPGGLPGNERNRK